GIVFPLPPTVSSVQGALVEPLANGIHVLSLLGGRIPVTVVILGAGSIGLLCLQAALAAGAERVAVTDVNPHRLEVARSLGAAATLETGRGDVPAFVRDWTGALGADLAVDAVGTPDARRDSVRAVRPGGDAVWIGLHD